MSIKSIKQQSKMQATCETFDIPIQRDNARDIVPTNTKFVDTSYLYLKHVESIEQYISKENFTDSISRETVTYETILDDSPQ